MKYVIWALGAMFIVFAASCDLLNPTANQATVEVSNTSGSSCPVTVSLDGNNAIVVASGNGGYTFPLVNTGSHTLNFSTGGTCPSNSNCVFTNNNTTSTTYNDTFNTVAGNVYVGQVVLAGSACGGLHIQGP